MKILSISVYTNNVILETDLFLFGSVIDKLFLNIIPTLSFQFRIILYLKRCK